MSTNTGLAFGLTIVILVLLGFVALLMWLYGAHCKSAVPGMEEGTTGVPNIIVTPVDMPQKLHKRKTREQLINAQESQDNVHYFEISVDEDNSRAVRSNKGGERLGRRKNIKYPDLQQEALDVLSPDLLTPLHNLNRNHRSRSENSMAVPGKQMRVETGVKSAPHVHTWSSDENIHKTSPMLQRMMVANDRQGGSVRVRRHRRVEPVSQSALLGAPMEAFVMSQDHPHLPMKVMYMYPVTQSLPTIDHNMPQIHNYCSHCAEDVVSDTDSGISGTLPRTVKIKRNISGASSSSSIYSNRVMSTISNTSYGSPWSSARSSDKISALSNASYESNNMIPMNKNKVFTLHGHSADEDGMIDVEDSPHASRRSRIPVPSKSQQEPTVSNSNKGNIKVVQS